MVHPILIQTQPYIMRILGKVGHVLSNSSHVLDSRTWHCFSSILLFWVCHCISSIVYRYLYIYINHGISGKWRRTSLGSIVYFNFVLYLPSLDFRYFVSLSIFWKITHNQYSHVWIFLYPKHNLLIFIFDWLHFVGNVEPSGNN